MAVPVKGNAAPSKRVADWLDWLGSHTVTLKCDSEPATLALAQEIRRLRRESSDTILEHPEEGEKQSNHLAEGREGPHQNLEGWQHAVEIKDRDWPISSTATMDH